MDAVFGEDRNLLIVTLATVLTASMADFCWIVKHQFDDVLLCVNWFHWLPASFKTQRKNIVDQFLDCAKHKMDVLCFL